MFKVSQSFLTPTTPGVALSHPSTWHSLIPLCGTLSSLHVVLSVLPRRLRPRAAAAAPHRTNDRTHDSSLRAGGCDGRDLLSRRNLCALRLQYNRRATSRALATLVLVSDIETTPY